MAWLKKKKKARVAVTALPRLSKSSGLELKARGVIQGLRVGRHRSPAHGSSLEFAEHRNYLPGDDLRRLDWRAYARSDQLLIRRYTDERSLPLTLAVDVSASMRYGRDKYPHAKLLAAVLGLLALDQGDDVSLVRMGEKAPRQFRSFNGIGASQGLADSIDALVDDLTVNWERVLPRLERRLQRRGLIVLISDFLDEPDQLLHPLASLRARGHDIVLIQVLHPDELVLPSDWGRVHLTDPEYQIDAVDCDAVQLGVAYAEALQEHQERLRRVAAAVRADHLLAPTDKPVAAVLGGWLAARARSGLKV